METSSEFEPSAFLLAFEDIEPRLLPAEMVEWPTEYLERLQAAVRAALTAHAAARSEREEEGRKADPGSS